MSVIEPALDNNNDNKDGPQTTPSIQTVFLNSEIPKENSASMFPLDIDSTDYEKTQLGFQIADRQSRLAEIEREIYNQVSENQDEFLSYISRVQIKGELFQDAKSDLSLLENSLESLKQKVRPSYQALSNKVNHLEKLQTISDVLHIISQYSQLVTQLHSTSKEIDSADLIIKIEKIKSEEVYLEEIHSIQPLRIYVKARKQRLYLKAKNDLEQCLRRKDNLLLASALSIVGSLGLVQEVLIDLGPQQTSALRVAVQQVLSNPLSNSSNSLPPQAANGLNIAYPYSFWSNWAAQLLP